MKGAGKNKQEKKIPKEAEEWNKIIFETLCRAGIKDAVLLADKALYDAKVGGKNKVCCSAD